MWEKVSAKNFATVKKNLKRLKCALVADVELLCIQISARRCVCVCVCCANMAPGRAVAAYFHDFTDVAPLQSRQLTFQLLAKRRNMLCICLCLCLCLCVCVCAYACGCLCARQLRFSNLLRCYVIYFYFLSL